MDKAQAGLSGESAELIERALIEATALLDVAIAGVVRAAEVLAGKWVTPGQKVDSADWLDAVNDLYKAVIKMIGEGEKGSSVDETTDAPVLNQSPT